jgi:hypothetical protein
MRTNAQPSSRSLHARTFRGRCFGVPVTCRNMRLGLFGEIEKQEVVCWAAAALHLRRRRFIDPATPLPQNIETHTHTQSLSLAAEANVSSRAPATPHTPDPQVSLSLSCRLKSCQPASQPLDKNDAALILVYREKERAACAESASSLRVCIYLAISKIGFLVRVGRCCKLIALSLIGSDWNGNVILVSGTWHFQKA